MEHDNQIPPEAPEPASPPAATAAPDIGLSATEAEERRLQYGLNEITEKKPHAILKFLRLPRELCAICGETG